MLDEYYYIAPDSRCIEVKGNGKMVIKTQTDRETKTETDRQTDRHKDTQRNIARQKQRQRQRENIPKGPVTQNTVIGLKQKENHYILKTVITFSLKIEIR